MKFFVKATAIAADSFTVLPRGIVYIDENMEPLLAKKTQELCRKYPEDINEYVGEEEGLDIKKSKEKAAEAEFEIKKKDNKK